MAHHYTQGKYYPVNRKKYIGNSEPIYRSGWELIVFSKLDEKPEVFRWGSESFSLPYMYELDGKQHKYYIDLYVEVINKQNKIDKLIIEIKPDAKLSPPIKPKSRTGKSLRNYNLQIADYIKNTNKWKFAKAYAVSNGISFYIMTEKGMYIFEDRPVKVSSAKFF